MNGSAAQWKAMRGICVISLLVKLNDNVTAFNDISTNIELVRQHEGTFFLAISQLLRVTKQLEICMTRGTVGVT